MASKALSSWINSFQRWNDNIISFGELRDYQTLRVLYSEYSDTTKISNAPKLSGIKNNNEINQSYDIFWKTQADFKVKFNTYSWKF